LGYGSVALIFFATFFLAVGGFLVAVAVDDGFASSAVTFGADWARFLFAVLGTFLAAIGVRGWFKVITGSKPDPQAFADRPRVKRLKAVGRLHVVIGAFLLFTGIVGIGDSVVVVEAGWAKAVFIVAGAWMVLVGLVFQVDLQPVMKKQLLQTGRGKPGRARILEVKDTGWTVNDSPRVELELEITPENGSPYIAALKGTVPRLSIGRLVPGDTVPVLIDETDPNSFIIEWGKP
jgi:hypothetical protein